MKQYKIAIVEDAINDIKSIVSYYEKQQPGLGKKFAIELQKRFKQLQKTPYASAIISGNKIFPSLKKFPFYISISIDEEERMVVVWAILHHKKSNDSSK